MHWSRDAVNTDPTNQTWTVSTVSCRFNVGIFFVFALMFPIESMEDRPGRYCEKLLSIIQWDESICLSIHPSIYNVSMSTVYTQHKAEAAANTKRPGQIKDSK